MNIKYFGHSVYLDTMPADLDRRRLFKGSIAGALREKYIFDALCDCKGISAINFISTAYGYRKGFHRTSEYEYGNRKFIFLGYIGFGVLRIVTSYLFSFIWIFINVKPKEVIVTYNFPPIYSIPLLLKKLVTGYKLIIEFEDFVNDNDRRSIIYKPLELLGIRYADSFIASSVGMMDYILKVRKNANVTINSGYYNTTNLADNTHRSQKQITILYSGTLVENRGLISLIKAFRSNRDEYFELVITGKGRLEGWITNMTKTDSRISFLGLVNRKTFEQVLQKSDICINPQRSNINVNFPSKITMYLSYGKIVLSTKLDSLIRSPFNKLLHYYDEDKPDTMWKQINIIKKNRLKLEDDRLNRITTYKCIMEEQKDSLQKWI